MNLYNINTNRNVQYQYIFVLERQVEKSISPLSIQPQDILTQKDENSKPDTLL